MFLMDDCDTNPIVCQWILEWCRDFNDHVALDVRWADHLDAAWILEPWSGVANTNVEVCQPVI